GADIRQQDGMREDIGLRRSSRTRGVVLYYFQAEDGIRHSPGEFKPTEKIFMHDIERFIDGFQPLPGNRIKPRAERSLPEAQDPTTLVIGCCDSRIDPAQLLACEPGDIF